MDLGLTDRVALVAGGSSGIGLAVATALAREGAHVAIGARDPDRLRAAAEALREVATGQLHTTSVDITDPEAVERWVEAVLAEFGALHIVLVNGAGPGIGPAGGFTLPEYRQAIDRSLLPAVGLTLTTVPHLRRAGWGRLLFIASETAAVPIARLAQSGMIRTAVLRFAQSLAAELGPAGVTVNVIAPGTIRTPPVERAAVRLAAGGDAAEHLAAMGHHCAIGRLGEPAEVGALAAFLASEPASFITGGLHVVDGGAGIVGPNLPHLNAGKDTYT